MTKINKDELRKLGFKSYNEDRFHKCTLRSEVYVLNCHLILEKKMQWRIYVYDAFVMDVNGMEDIKDFLELITKYD